VITVEEARQMYDEFTRLEEAMRMLGFTDAEIAEVWRKAPKNKRELERSQTAGQTMSAFNRNP
jgi:Holliday junction resolvasome RuvABC DNA-binding subunit